MTAHPTPAAALSGVSHPRATLADVLTSDELWSVLWALKDRYVGQVQHRNSCRHYAATGVPIRCGLSWAKAVDRAESEIAGIDAVVAKFPAWMGEAFRRAVAEDVAS